MVKDKIVSSEDADPFFHGCDVGYRVALEEVEKLVNKFLISECFDGTPGDVHEFMMEFVLL